MLTESLSLSSTGDESLELMGERQAYCLDICERGDAERADIEAFVRKEFLRVHGAQVRSFLPVMLVLRDPAGEIAAVTGLRRAHRERLYLESYLDRPIEKALEASLPGRGPLRRESIVEIGNFAARYRAEACELMRRLPRFLLARGALWIVFTATRAVRRMLSEFGVRPLELSPARPECLTDAASEWGNYYRCDPRVMAGFLPAALALEAFSAVEVPY